MTTLVQTEQPDGAEWLDVQDDQFVDRRPFRDMDMADLQNWRTHFANLIGVFPLAADCHELIEMVIEGRG